MRLVFLLVVIAASLALAQTRPRRAREAPPKDNAQTAQATARQQRNRQIAAQFAPILYQGLGDKPRADYITNFDFDGDWKGDNNWQNLDNRNYRLLAYVYYSVAETQTHYYVHYAFFHPRDYKGDVISSTVLDDLIRKTLPRIGKDPTGGMANDVALSHENDLEGCLVVAEKRGDDLAQAQVLFVETMAHNRYLKYRAPAASSIIGDPIELNGSHPLLFAEPRGHGIARYTSDSVQLNKRVVNGIVSYSYTGKAEDPEANTSRSVGYDLTPIYETFWERALKGENETYSETLDYQTFSTAKHHENKAVKLEQRLGVLGATLRGNVGFKNKARPPWGWFDDTERERPRGEWFFDPAVVIARHFNLGQEWATAYVYHPYFKIEP
jgi:hypothetical protein